MIFEYDQDKSRSNRQKHGIDFDTAQMLWDDPQLLEIAARPVKGEQRSLVLGQIAARLWAAVITRRGEAVRIISVRRARKNEGALYDES